MLRWLRRKSHTQVVTNLWKAPESPALDYFPNAVEAAGMVIESREMFSWTGSEVTDGLMLDGAAYGHPAANWVRKH